MEELTVLNTEREYDHQESKELLGQVRDFFQTRLRIIVPEWTTKKEISTETVSEGVVEAFSISKQAEPIYANCNGYDDLTDILGLFEERLNSLLDNLDDLLDNNSDLDEESKKSLASYASALDKCISVYGIQTRKRMSKFKELSTVKELQEELQQLFSEIIANYIITVLLDALYERVKNNSGQVYGMIVREVNKFLAENGVYTKKISIGEPINPEYMEPTPDSAENYTDDFQLFDTIDEIRRYPYVFGDGKKILDGRVRIWRRKG